MKNKLFMKVLSVLLFVVLSVFGLGGCFGLTQDSESQSAEKTISLDVTQKELGIGESFTLTVTAPSETPDNNSGSDVQDSTQSGDVTSDTASDVQSSATFGCFGSVAGISMLLPALAAVAVALTKKKED